MKDFSKTTQKHLAAIGIKVIGTTFIPGPDGSFANGERAYQLDDNGTMRIRTFAEVLEMAELVSCGRCRGRNPWQRMKLVGQQKEEGAGTLELRNCDCGNTLAREVAS